MTLFCDLRLFFILYLGPSYITLLLLLLLTHMTLLAYYICGRVFAFALLELLLEQTRAVVLQAELVALH